MPPLVYCCWLGIFPIKQKRVALVQSPSISCRFRYSLFWSCPRLSWMEGESSYELKQVLNYILQSLFHCSGSIGWCLQVEKHLDSPRVFLFLPSQVAYLDEEDVGGALGGGATAVALPATSNHRDLPAVPGWLGAVFLKVGPSSPCVALDLVDDVVPNFSWGSQLEGTRLTR